MKSVWREYRAPNGKKYYHNTTTGETTWDSPYTRKPQRELSIKPQYVIPLLNAWNLVICNNGAKFYLNPDGDPVLTLDDADSSELLSLVDREKLILLIGVARGYHCTSGDKVYNSVLEEISFLKDDLANDKAPLAEERELQEEPLETNVQSEPVPSALVSGYGSSSDGSDDEEEVPPDTDANRISYFNLFSEYGLDKYSVWSIESLKISNDPRFHIISDDRQREEIFEEWCCSGVVDDSEDEGYSSGDDDLSPTKYHYLSQIVAKSTVTPTTIFQDIKQEKASLFKQYGIKQFLSKREQEQFVSQLLFYYKKFTLEERVQLFTKFIAESRTGTVPSPTSPADSATPEDIETNLLQMESHLPPTVLDNTVYYTLDIKTKQSVLHRMLPHG
ncbi:Urn1p KNAG_0A07970 [Huiozyma naganishii CBS 8797]|uniref:WW domain-containing protein n=1 Tax=Huiozyma naganishii (strain ATCC MYA-139 / BCRC 22969 / CBS 8797 / KCTC 17520 / NBRC 10181 / NCYC 3082 / Yp74L-3) TaxID=1071383 RepID=J7R0W8_HUIN7|nr:hypothetical protein KNAG_0A07970 [Kazachstania naganishii CBS 8797]CCK68450.1 hypothetical protein KNAG_0A07970 [Kazachstania naganishii CBS 8797]